MNRSNPMPSVRKIVTYLGEADVSSPSPSPSAKRIVTYLGEADVYLALPASEPEPFQRAPSARRVCVAAVPPSRTVSELLDRIHGARAKDVA